MILPEHIIQPSPEKCMPKLYAYLSLKHNKILNNNTLFYIYRFSKSEIHIKPYVGLHNNRFFKRKIIIFKNKEFWFRLYEIKNKNTYKLYK